MKINDKQNHKAISLGKGRRRPNRRRGMALVCTMLVLMVVLCTMLLGVVSINNRQPSSGLLYNTSNASNQSNTRMNQTQAFNLAESGVEYTLEWLHEQSSPPSNTAAFAPTIWNATTTNNRSVVSFGGGTFSILMYPDPNNSSNTQKKFMIESVGSDGSSTSVLEAYVEQSSFGKYGYFTNTDPSNNYWVGGLSQSDGPVHSNNADGVETNILWYNDQANSQCFLYTGSDAYTCSAPGVNWLENSLYTSGSPQSSSDWLDVAAGGAGSVHYSVPTVPLPTTNTAQQTAAIGTASVPTSASATGVTVSNAGGSTTGGVYIHGAVQNMTLSVSNSVNQIITISQTDSSGNPLTTVVTMNRQTNQTTVAVTSGSVAHPSTTTSTYTGTTNGVVYADSSIGTSNSDPGQGLSGTVADNVVSGSTITARSELTIATDPSASIYLNGSLKYNTARPVNTTSNTFSAETSTFTQNAGILGLLSQNVWGLKYTATGAVNSTEEVDAVVLATGTFDMQAYEDVSVHGQFYGMGSYIVGHAGYFGLVDMSGNILGGYGEHHSYDPRLADNPPPFFPTTGTQYDVVSWNNVSNIMS